MFSQLPLFIPLLTPHKMRRWDQLATELFEFPKTLLIENASREAYHALKELVPLTPQTRILIIAGSGNNGGDGFALARHLHNDGNKVLVVHSSPLHKATGALKEHIMMAQRLGVNFLPLAKDSNPFVLPLEWRYPDVIIDAICGTGMTGELRQKELSIVRHINAIRKHSFIFSLDIPTGLCGECGKPMPEAVHAHATITFEAGKPGLFLPGAADYTGEIRIRSIGLPSQLQTEEPPSWLLVSPTPGEWAKPPKGLHKGLAGKVLIIGGCEQYFGAPILSALGALRAGAGLVHLACSRKMTDVMRHQLPEMIVHGIGTGANWEGPCAEELQALLDTVNPAAVVLGPGLGRSEEAKRLVQHLVNLDQRPPLVIDADALSFFYLPVGQRSNAAATISTQLLRSSDILTPHPFEFAQLLPKSFFAAAERAHEDEKGALSYAKVLQADRPRALHAFTGHCLATLVLKGAYTLIGQQATPTALASFDIPALATAGSGDVLSGVIGTLVAQQVQPLEAAALGVYLHAKAGQYLQERAPKGHTATDIANAIPQVWNALCPDKP